MTVGTDIVTRVHASRFLFLFFLVGLLSGCSIFHLNSHSTPYVPYFKVRVTDPEGALVAEWIAQGKVSTAGIGYRFTAVQRISGPRYSILTKYPLGRKVYIEGPNIIISPIGKPLWLHRWQGFGAGGGKETIR